MLHGGNVACAYSIPGDLWLVDVDKGQMSQVIQNMIINAKHAMPNGGTIGVICENVDGRSNTAHSLPSQDNYIKIEISDTGIGIPDSILDKIFDPYFTTKQEGSGLGLAIAHSIICKHNGSISVKSAPGAGTTFSLYLPVSGRQQEKQKESPAVTSVCKAKILVMDDDKMIRDMAREMLELLGHEVVLARHGEEAIELFKKHSDAGDPIDITFMDLTIQAGMGGKFAVKEILSLHPGAKVVVSSGYSNDQVMAHYREYGFAAAIGKPFELQEITNLINQLLNAGNS